MFTVNMARAPSHRVPETRTTGRVVPQLFSPVIKSGGTCSVRVLWAPRTCPTCPAANTLEGSPRRAAEREGSGHAAGTPGQPQAQ